MGQLEFDSQGWTARCHTLQRHFTCSWVGHLLVTGPVLHYLHQMESLLTEIFEVAGDAETGQSNWTLISEIAHICEL